MRVRDVSDGSGRPTRQRARAVAGPAGLGPRQGSGTRAHRSNRAAGKSWAAGPKARKGSKFLFLFSFSNISNHFQIILNPLLNLNQTTHHKNLNATA
jgi:hypothetical protein